MIGENVALEVLREGADDWVPIDALLWHARAVSGGEDFRRVAIESLAFLMTRGLAMVGDIGESGFEPWRGELQAVLDRVTACCAALNWEPQGGCCWISATADGSAFVNAHE
ncbi:hypothetical protein [Kitasatospora sp. GAS1066B]|uniref:hypothetical protein n=1 Tax=Kitasatospora sp. GAS1066B TaxID=3156271 RepID=UPI003519D407